MLATLATLASLATLAGCSAEPVQVSPPDASAQSRDLCRVLADDLPDALDDRDRRDTSPESPLTAAWGDPAVVLRCGVDTPEGLTATSEILEVNDVEWFLTESRSAYTFTTVGRAANVEVAVPTEVPRSAATASLTYLAEPLRAAVPPKE